MITLNHDLTVTNEDGEVVGKVVGTGYNNYREGFCVLYRILLKNEFNTAKLLAPKKKPKSKRVKLTQRAIKL